jgi:hypothetical protein
MCSKVSCEIETFEGASLGVGITKPTADFVKDFLGFMLGHTFLFAKPARIASSLRRRYSYFVLRIFSCSVG